MLILRKFWRPNLLWKNISFEERPFVRSKNTIVGSYFGLSKTKIVYHKFVCPKYAIWTKEPLWFELSKIMMLYHNLELSKIQKFNVTSRVCNLDQIANVIGTFQDYNLYFNFESSKITLVWCIVGSQVLTYRQTDWLYSCIRSYIGGAYPKPGRIVSEV